MKVLATGTFDNLHQGHRYFLRQAADLGDQLWVIIARDHTVKQIKNHPPKLNENDRLKQIENLDYVYKAQLGDENDPYTLVTEIKPDIIALGYDQVAFTENLATILKKYGLQPEIKRLTAYKPDQFKTSLLNHERKRN